MKEITKILCLAFIAACIDVFWLLLQSSWVQDIIRDIQGGRAMNMRLWAAIPVYLAAGYLITQVPSAPRAFLAGFTSYAIYDFTQISLLDRYPFAFAISDSLWGGVLFSLTWWVGNQFGILNLMN